MANFKVRDQRKEQLWRRWIREWRASGVPVRAFCEARGLAEASFYGWRRELERRDAHVPQFIPVHITDAPVTGVGALDLVLPGNRTIRVGAGFDAATLRQLLTVLEDKPC